MKPAALILLTLYYIFFYRVCQVNSAQNQKKSEFGKYKIGISFTDKRSAYSRGGYTIII